MSFGRWICVSLPFGVLNTLIAWAYLIMIVKPDDIQSIPVIVYERGLPVFGKRNITVIASSLLVILLFANFTYVKDMFGEIGIVAAMYVVFMFGSGILSEVSKNFFVCIFCVLQMIGSWVGASCVCLASYTSL